MFLETGEYEAARLAYNKSLAIHRDLIERLGTPDSKRAIMIPLHRLTTLSLQTNDLPAARAFYAEAQTLIPTLHPLHVEEVRAAFARLAHHLQD